MSRTVFRATVPILAASALFLATAGGVLAKCEHDPDEICPAAVTATLDMAGGGLAAGASETIGVWVLEGDAPYDATGVDLILYGVGDGTLLRVAATPSTTEGRWEAVVDLPDGGTWTLVAEVRGTDFSASLPLETVQVDPPAIVPVAATTGASSASLLAIAPWAALAAIVALGFAGLALMSRRRQTPASG